MIRPFGEHALLVEVDGPDAAGSLAASLTSDRVDGVEAAVPALASVLVELEPRASGRAGQIAEELAARMGTAALATVPRRIRTIPVAYGGAHGPDLEETATMLAMAPDELAARHAATELRVLFCGFAPGYAYLGELPDALHAPRLAVPRTRTPPGSVALAGPMSGIYPADLPGGWRVIGRTPLILFDPRREPPAYLAAGDIVRWRPIGADDWPDAPAPAADW